MMADPGTAHGLIQTARGLCSDEEPHVAIDTLLAHAVDAVKDVEAERVRLREIIGRLYEQRGGDRRALCAAIKRAFREANPSNRRMSFNGLVCPVCDVEAERNRVAKLALRVARKYTEASAEIDRLRAAIVEHRTTIHNADGARVDSRDEDERLWASVEVPR